MLRRTLFAISIVVSALIFVSVVVGSTSVSVVAQSPTLQPTETAVPLVTPTTLPAPPPRPLPVVKWDDVSLHKRAMKPEFAEDVERWKDGNRYAIWAELTIEGDAVIRGAERVRYTNHSNDALSVIVFRLYPNGPALGGRMTVSRVEVAGQVIDPSYSVLSSVMGVPLPTPLAPGASVELKIDFGLVMTQGLDTSYGRFGFVRDIVSSTAWYPTLSVYEPGRGWWDSLPSPSGDPAYTETGLYDVHLTVPAGFTVAMSGTTIETTQNANGTTTYRDVTGPMRDHAFQASPRYMISPVEVDGTTINVVHYKDRATLDYDGTAEVQRFSITSIAAFNRVFGQYPYREFDIVQNPTPSGVEFPGLVQIADRSWRKGEPYLEIVVAHEIGHQWFYALVGNNQVEHPWLDESLTSYTEFVYMREAYRNTTKPAEYVNRFQSRYTRYTGSGQPDQPLNLPVRSYSGIGYGAIIYGKGPLFFIELERQLGRETVYLALKTYFARLKYNVAVSADMEATFEEVSGRDLSALFRKWVGLVEDDGLASSRLVKVPPAIKFF